MPYEIFALPILICFTLGFIIGYRTMEKQRQKNY
ncbi:hypothetical protein SAMN05421740_102257 [Parapedobacter koreensis]|uniref:Uncharacterized protein n=1 Tax=Parapedobacter koreensis TaxID=332977 RepID=A0A1H7INU6_9SPHI|nr:hypothetical protein SAMN05421740_102257 [Parapedobacter koreensis]